MKKLGSFVPSSDSVSMASPASRKSFYSKLLDDLYDALKVAAANRDNSNALSVLVGRIIGAEELLREAEAELDEVQSQLEKNIDLIRGPVGSDCYFD